VIVGHRAFEFSSKTWIFFPSEVLLEPPNRMPLLIVFVSIDAQTALQHTILKPLIIDNRE